ncbi:hypothetical protein RA20_08735 [Leisingera sp. ANG-Vp]|nr:hypothetical protein RA20_08735 [Leisingera sp. ANG-Vp]
MRLRDQSSVNTLEPIQQKNRLAHSQTVQAGCKLFIQDDLTFRPTRLGIVRTIFKSLAGRFDTADLVEFSHWPRLHNHTLEFDYLALELQPKFSY